MLANSFSITIAERGGGGDGLGKKRGSGLAICLVDQQGKALGGYRKNVVCFAEGREGVIAGKAGTV